MTSVPLAVALTAGSLAAVNPCGFALLPGYLGMFITGPAQQPRGPAAAVARAVVTTAAMTVGFMVVFGAFALVAAPAATAIHAALPWITIVIGTVVALTGCWLLAGRTLYPRLPILRLDIDPHSMVTAIGYGVVFAVASLSCTVGPFLALVVSTFRTSTIWEGIGGFAAYAAGMGAAVGVVAVAVALAQDRVIRAARRVLPVVNRIGGGLMIVAGTYVAWYGWYSVRIADGADPADPVIEAAFRLQGNLSTAVAAVPWWVWIGAVVGASVLAALTVRRRSRSHPDERLHPAP